MKPRLLDLFSGAGGAARGYQQAGFYVVGVDIVPQPHYCGDEFHQADALEFPLDGFDVIHASPPCQAYTGLRARHKSNYPDLIAGTREKLQATGKPWVIENVPGAPLIDPIRLCGSSFGLRVRKHRLFESCLDLQSKPCDHAWQDADKCFTVRDHGKFRKTGVCYVFGNGTGKSRDWRKAMGIGWMTWAELSQAIPPAYTEWVGLQLLRRLEAGE